MENEYTEIDPVHPVAPYIGGKRNLAKKIIERIEQVPHVTYAEPFCGMGGVFFRRRLQPKAEVINDISGDVTTLFRILQRHYTSFIQEMRFQLHGRKTHERLKKTDPSTLTDIERAARFLYLQRTSFGGKVTGQNFGVTPSRGASFNIAKLEPMLADMHERLCGVAIENLPYEELIKKYDRDMTLFYLDPPYFGCENDYGKEVFSRSDFEKLAAILNSIKGKFILSLNDKPEVREIFKDFDIEAVDCSYSIGGKTQKQRTFGEVIITG